MKSYSSINNIFFETIVGGVSKLLGILGLLYAAWTFGASRDTDFVYFSTAIIFTILGFFTTINGNIILPQFMLLQSEKRKEDAWNMACTFLTIACAFVSVFSILIYLVFKYRINYISKFEAINQESVELLGLIVSATLIVAYLADFLSNLFKGYRNFFIPNLAMALGSFAGFLFLILASDYYGAISIAFSFLITQTVQLLILWCFLVRRNIYIRIHMRGLNDLNKSFKLMPPYLISQTGAAIVILFPNYLLTGFDGGALTAITYARRIFELVPALLVIPIISALTPNFNDILLSKNRIQIAEKLSKISAILYSMLIPISVFFIINSKLIVIAALGWKNYSAAEQDLTANAINWYFMALFVLGSNAVITKALVMTQDVRLAYVSLVFAAAPAVGVPLLSVVGIYLIGITGVAAGYSTYLIFFHLAIGYFAVEKIFNKFDLRGEVTSILRPFLYSVISAGMMLFAETIISLAAPFELIVLTCVYACSYVGLHMIFNTSEFNFIKSRLRGVKDASQGY